MYSHGEPCRDNKDKKLSKVRFKIFKKLRKNKVYIVKLDSDNAKGYSLFLKLLNIVYTGIEDKDKSANYTFIILVILNSKNIIDLLYNSYTKLNSNF